MTPLSATFSVEEGCELDWDEASFEFYGGGLVFIRGPDGLLFSTYDTAYMRYYEVEYLLSPDGKIAFITFFYPEDADDIDNY